MTKSSVLVCGALFCSFMLFSGTSFAGTCGKGRVVELSEGGWNTDNFYIKINYDDKNSSHPGTEHFGYIRFANGLSEARMKGIRAIALVAFASGDAVEAFSHNSDCASATELKMSL